MPAVSDPAANGTAAAMPPPEVPLPAVEEAQPAIWPAGVASAVGYLVVGIVLHLAGAASQGMFPAVLRGPEFSWLPVLALGCAGLLFRSARVPIMLVITGTAIVISVLFGGHIATYLLTFELFYSSVLYGPPRLSRNIMRIAVAAAAASVVASWLANQDWRFALFALLQAVVVCLVPIWWAGTVRQHKDMAAVERARADAERMNTQRAAELAVLDLRMAVTAERAQMARDLHDVIAGHLSAVALQSAAALAAGNSELDRRVLGQVRQESLTALEEMRTMIDLLEAGETTDRMAGGIAELEVLAESARVAGNPVDIVADSSTRLPALIDSSVYRLVQEALTNAIKHAPGQPVEVRVASAAGAVRVRITNPLPPDATGEAGSGKGLRNMALRTRQLGGTFSAGMAGSPAGGRRWQVEAALPVTAAEHQEPAI